MRVKSGNHAQVLHNNSLINLHSIEAARQNRVTRYLYTSSAYVYPEYRQTATNCIPQRKDDAYPDEAQDAYESEDLVSERLCIRYRQDYGLETRIVRLHDIFGPLGNWLGGQEEAPATLCRKIAAARLEAIRQIEIWGDGEQTRSFCYIDDCVTGLCKVMRSDCREPLNLSQHRMVSINELADIIANIAGVHLNKTYLPGPEGARARNSDNTRLKEILRWEPQISLEEGLRRTYIWIEKQVRDIASEYSFGVATFPLRTGEVRSLRDSKGVIQAGFLTPRPQQRRGQFSVVRIDRDEEKHD
jgi:nucleoside-diphosphate-sugar epimerase